MNYTISKHAQERYAERIMEKESTLETNSFIVSHQDKIQEDIYKMIEFGKEIFDGPSFSEYNKKRTKVILSGTWILILDPVSNTVITLYKRDLGLGEEFNKEYINKLVSKYELEREEYQNVAYQVEEKKEQYEKDISYNANKIAEYKQMIKSLEAQNSALRTLQSELYNNLIEAEQPSRNTLGAMIGRRTY